LADEDISYISPRFPGRSIKAMADPTEKRLLARINDDLEWRSKRFRLGRKTYEFEEMGELLANIRRRTGYRFKPALVPAGPCDSDITDHGESSEDEDEDEDEEEKVGDKYMDNTDCCESSSEDEDEKKVGDDYLNKMTDDDDEDEVGDSKDDEKTGEDEEKPIDEMDDLEVANKLADLVKNAGY
jgi:hypothetical protein